MSNTIGGKGLYLAYTSAVAREASHKFPPGVECKTTHSLAYRYVMSSSTYTLGVFNYRSIKEPIVYENKCGLVDSIKQFCLSRFTSFSEFAKFNELPKKHTSLGNKYLNLMSEGKIDCTHEFYLKLFHIYLSTGDVVVPRYDLLMLDECVVGRTGIKTDSGTMSILSLYNMQTKGKILPMAKSFNEATKAFEYKEIANVFSNGIKDVYEVTTTSKVKLKGTSKHKVKTQTGYKNIADLVPYKDYILTDNTKNLRSSKLLNQDQLQHILGGYLGDGSIIQEKVGVHCYSMRFTQGEAQLPYLKWKIKPFKDLKLHKSYSGYTGKKSIYQTSNAPNFILDSSPFSQVINNLNELGLAIWLMDDGSVRNGCIGTSIHSNSFSFEENQKLCSMLLKRFGLKSKVLSNSKGHWGIHFGKKDTAKLLSAVKPYLHPIFLHKWMGIVETLEYLCDDSFTTTGGSYVESVKQLTPEKVYDLSVVDNNNYITTSTAGKESSVGLLVHNCGDINEVTLEIFKLIPASRKVAVGDKYQNIFTFNHTINCFSIIPENEKVVFSMSKSFRVKDKIAKRIQHFMRNFTEDDYTFVGIDTDKKIETRAYLTRTNSSLVAKMIELNKSGTPYSLLRSPKEIFKLPLMLSSMKHKGFVSNPAYKHLQKDYNDWYNDEDLKMRFKNPISYIKNTYADDVPLSIAASLLLKHGSALIYETYKEASSHTSNRQPLILASAHSSKGSEYDEVIICNDLNSTVQNLILEVEAGTVKEGSIEYLDVINLYYVACSRAKKSLVGADALEYTKNPLSIFKR